MGLFGRNLSFLIPWRLPTPLSLGMENALWRPLSKLLWYEKGSSSCDLCVEDFVLGSSSSDPCFRVPCHLSALILLSKMLWGGLFCLGEREGSFPCACQGRRQTSSETIAIPYYSWGLLVLPYYYQRVYELPQGLKVSTFLLEPAAYQLHLKFTGMGMILRPSNF